MPAFDDSGRLLVAVSGSLYNADLLDGYHASALQLRADGYLTGGGAVATGGYTLTLSSSGTLALSGYTLTAPATGTALLAAGDALSGQLSYKSGYTVGASPFYVGGTLPGFSASDTLSVGPGAGTRLDWHYHDASLSNELYFGVVYNAAPGSTVIGSLTYDGTYDLRIAAAAVISGTNTGDSAANSSTHYIGTTAVALNRASANLALTGILSVGMPGATSGTLTLQPAAVAGTNTITLPAATGTAALGTGAANRLALWNGTNDLTSSANLTYDGTTLTVNSATADVTVNSSTGRVAMVGSAANVAATRIGNQATFTLSRVGGSIGAETVPVSGNGIAALAFAGWAGTGTFPAYDLVTGARILAVADETFSASAAGTYIDFQTVPTGGSTTLATRLRITSAGRVGIGTTAPDKAVEINDAAGACLRLTYNDSNGSAANYADLDVSSSGDLTITPRSGDVVIASGGSLGIGAAPSSALWIQRDGAQPEIFLNTAGNVTTIFPNIVGKWARGTISSPSAANSGDTVFAFGGRAYAATGYAPGNTARIAFVTEQAFTDTAYGTYIAFETTALNSTSRTEKMRITAGGNVGIGTSTFGTSAAGVLALFNGTVPSTSPADTVQLFSVDLSAGNATLGIRTETAVATETVTSDRTLSVKINGTTYKILLKA